MRVGSKNDIRDVGSIADLVLVFFVHCLFVPLVFLLIFLFSRFSRFSRFLFSLGNIVFF